MKRSPILLIALICLSIFSCKSIREMRSLTKCQFRIGTVDQIKLANVDIQTVRKFSDLQIKDAAKVTTAMVSGNLPLSMVINLEVKNPNKRMAAMNRVDWIAMVDDYQLLNGIVTERVEVEPNGGTATIPIGITANIKEILKSMGKNEMLDFGMGITDQAKRPTRVAIKLKPSIMVGKHVLQYPGWFTVKRDFVSQ